MVEPVTMAIMGAGLGIKFIPALCKFIYKMLTRKRKLKREKKAREELVKEAMRGEQRDAEWKAAMNMQQEELEKRMEAETKRGIAANQQLMQFVQLCMKMFFQMMQQQQQKAGAAAAHCSRCHTSQNQSKGHYAKTSGCCPDEHQNYDPYYEVEFPDEFGDDKELLKLFSSSLFLQLQDSEFSDNVEWVDHPMKDIALLELPDEENILLLESPDDQYSDEENILSLVLATINGASDGIDEAKEEGNAYFHDKKFDEAIKCYTKSIDQSPTAAAYGNRAMSYLKLNKFIQAEEDCTEALKIDGNYYKAYARRAIARTKLGRNLNAALEDVEFALEREPNSQEMKKLHAELKRSLSEGSSVERAYGRDAKHCATQAKDKGNAYYKEQKFGEAIKCYTKSIDISPTAAAYGNRAEAYMKLNKYAEAEEDCTKALKLNDKYFKVYARRAIARNILKRNLEGALEDAESALKLEPANLDMKMLRAELMNIN